MLIELNFDEETLGECSNDATFTNYTNAVQRAVKSAYPNADLRVNTSSIQSHKVYSDDEDEEDVLDTIHTIEKREFENPDNWVEDDD